MNNEQVLTQKLKPFMDNPELVKGLVLMAYAIKTDDHEPQKLERSESFAFYIVATFVQNILQLDMDRSELLRNEIVFDAIGSVTCASLELAEKGILTEESVFSDGCPYLRVNDKEIS